LFRGDADHVHHKLLKRGLSQPQAVLVLYFVTAAFGLLALVVLQRENFLVPVVVALVVAICAGVRQLHYAEFSRVSVSFPRSIQHRQIVADRANIHRATESLKSCADFRTICQVLQETLQPVGFDGIRVNNLGKDGLSASAIHPLQYDPDGTLSFTWSARKIVVSSRQEYYFELVISSHPAWGHLSLFGLSDDEDFQLGLDILSEDFRTALSNAVARAISAMKAMRPAPQEARVAHAGSPDSL
jgi:hypothetical protein